MSLTRQRGALSKSPVHQMTRWGQTRHRVAKMGQIRRWKGERRHLTTMSSRLLNPQSRWKWTRPHRDGPVPSTTKRPAIKGRAEESRVAVMTPRRRTRHSSQWLPARE
eukprot:684664-Pyramimonas_sp.AAC.1